MYVCCYCSFYTNHTAAYWDIIKRKKELFGNYLDLVQMQLQTKLIKFNDVGKYDVVCINMSYVVYMYD